MSDEPRSTEGSFEATRRRQMLLGAKMTMPERLAWLEARRDELTRLRALMPDAQRDETDSTSS